ETMQYDADAFDGGDGPDEPSGPPYRAIAMVLLAAVVLAIGIGLVQLFGGDDDSTPAAEEQSTSQVEDQGEGAAQSPADGQSDEGQPADQQPAPPAEGAEGDDPQAQQPEPDADTQGQPAQEPAPGPDVTSVPVQVFNNSNVSGLAGQTGDTLRADGAAGPPGATLRDTGLAAVDRPPRPSNRGVCPASTVYFGPGPGEQQAAEAVAARLGIPAAPRPGDLVPGTDGVIVIVTQDLAR